MTYTYIYLSNVRLGIMAEQIKDISVKTIDKLMTDVEPATLQVMQNKNLSPQERDVERAKLIRETLK